MDRTASPLIADSAPFVRTRRIELEPVLFAVSLMAIVLAVSLWQPSRQHDQPRVTEQATQVAAKPAT